MPGARGENRRALLNGMLGDEVDLGKMIRKAMKMKERAEVELKSAVRYDLT